MRHFDYLSQDIKSNIFYKQPESFTKYCDRHLLEYALGATLYSPATRLNIANDIITGKHCGLASMVICLEDAIGDNEVEAAEMNLVDQLLTLHSAVGMGSLSMDCVPLIFVRVRNPQQIAALIESLKEAARLVCGFVFPKFCNNQLGQNYFEVLKQYNAEPCGPFYGMPILETDRIMFQESRLSELLSIKSLLDDYRNLVLNVRIGATDFSGLFGIRRGPEVTVYEILPISSCISDIVNIFGRSHDHFVISGPVWEYFPSGGRVLKPQLRQSPFKDFYGTLGANIREQLLNNFVDGLIREVMLDKENGLVGKTTIHPSHIIPVQSLYAVSHEEYVDACNILANLNGQLGVVKSQYTNKMNEIKPHYNWAQKIMLRAAAYGVLNEEFNFTALLTHNPNLSNN